jgi:phosphoglycolate phosphatase-like HAD superfamily hydrolase
MRRLLIFDFDGTLADTRRDIAIALNRTLREAGHSAASDVQVRAWIGKGVVHLIERALPDALRSPQRGRPCERFCLLSAALDDAAVSPARHASPTSPATGWRS